MNVSLEHKRTNSFPVGGFTPGRAIGMQIVFAAAVSQKQNVGIESMTAAPNMRREGHPLGGVKKKRRNAEAYSDRIVPGYLMSAWVLPQIEKHCVSTSRRKPARKKKREGESEDARPTGLPLRSLPWGSTLETFGFQYGRESPRIEKLDRPSTSQLNHSTTSDR